MRNLYRLFIIISFAAIIATPTAVFADDDSQPKTWNVKHNERKMGKATDGKALVYFLRPQFMGFAIKFWQFVDDKLVAVTKGKQYSFAMVSPGEHIFWAKSENVNALKMTVEAGKTYYLQQKVKVGGFRANVRLRLLEDEAVINKALKKSKTYVTTTKMAHDKAMTKYLPKYYTEAKDAAAKNKNPKVGHTILPDLDVED